MHTDPLTLDQVSLLGQRRMSQMEEMKWKKYQQMPERRRRFG
jgi:hypothetical protein